MTDVETTGTGTAAAAPPNPYQSGGQQLFPPNHFIHKLKRIVYIILSCYVLHHFKFFKSLIKSSSIRRPWFEFGIALTIAILLVKAYVETYEGRVRKKDINYKNYPQTTHTVIALVLLSTLTFNIALWPHYGWNTPILLGVCFFGVILQFLLIVPTYVQNMVGLAALTFFLQEYTGMSMMY